MTLPYRIVWVDDSPDWVESARVDVEEHLVDLAYDPKIEVFETGEGVEKRCADGDVDLIIVDYQLHEKNGDKLIGDLRESGNFTEIVFYSQAPLADLPRGDAINGVFRCQRDDAGEMILRVIDNTLHKMRDLGVVRGLVIATAIDLEMKIEEIMVSAFGDGGELLQTRILEKGWIEFKNKSDFLNGLVKDLMKGLDAGERREGLEAVRNILNGFDKEIVAPRNLLAHARRVEKDGKPALEGRGSAKGKFFNDDWIAEVRENLVKHKKNLERLEELLAT